MIFCILFIIIRESNFILAIHKFNSFLFLWNAYDNIFLKQTEHFKETIIITFQYKVIIV